jgi:hypothetical protein
MICCTPTFYPHRDLCPGVVKYQLTFTLYQSFPLLRDSCQCQLIDLNVGGFASRSICNEAFPISDMNNLGFIKNFIYSLEPVQKVLWIEFFIKSNSGSVCAAIIEKINQTFKIINLGAIKCFEHLNLTQQTKFDKNIDSGIREFHKFLEWVIT